MRVKVYAGIALLVLVVTSLGLAVDTPPAKRAAGLVGMLPASDAVAVIDAKRFLNDAMPRILAANQPMLAKITGKMEEFQTTTGIDPRKFDQVVVGLKAKPAAAGKVSYDPVAIARGDFNSATLIAAAKTASENKFREEKLGERTIYIFNAREIAAAKVTDPKHRAVLETMKGSGEMALAALDANTIAFGSVARVRETLQRGTGVGADVLALLPTTGSPIVAFAGHVQERLSNMLPLHDDELGKNLAAIRYVAGTMDMNGGNAVVHMMARTLKADQADNLYTQIQGLQVVGKAILGSSTRADQQVYARMIDNAKIVRQGTDITLDLQVAQSDIDILIGKK